MCYKIHTLLLSGPLVVQRGAKSGFKARFKNSPGLAKMFEIFSHRLHTAAGYIKHNKTRGERTLLHKAPPMQLPRVQFA
jgi:hypothetical protein